MKNYSKEEFNLVVSTITGFTDQVGGELLSKALIGATTPKYANVRLGIKGTQAINLLDSTPSFQEGACGWSPSGNTTYTQVNLSVCPERLNEAACVDTLYGTYQSLLLQPGQTEESIPFEEMISSLKVKQIQQRIEQKLWQATKAGGDCFDGLKTVLASGQTGVGVSDGTAFSATAAYGVSGNPISEVDLIINELSDDAMSFDDLTVFMSYANFRLYVQAMTKANFFQNYIGSSSITGNMEAIHPNTNIRVVPTIGLNGSNMIVIAPAKYIVVGFDLLSDHERLDVWYSKDNDEIRFRANYNYGVAVPKFGSTVYFATNGLA